MYQICEKMNKGNNNMIVATANGLIAKSLDEHLSRLSLGGWIKGLIQKALTTGKLDPAATTGGTLFCIFLNVYCSF